MTYFTIFLILKIVHSWKTQTVQNIYNETCIPFPANESVAGPEIICPNTSIHSSQTSHIYNSVAIKGDYASPTPFSIGDIWQCLEIFLIFATQDQEQSLLSFNG